MTLHRKIASTIGLAFIGLFEIAERADFIKAHLPEWITMHSDLTVITLLIGLCFWLIFTRDEQPLPPISNVNMDIGNPRIEVNPRFEHTILVSPSAVSHQMPSQPKHKHNVRFVGFRQTGDTPHVALLCFQNVPIAGEPVGEFRSARLKITYHEPEGKEIAEIFPALWWGDSQAAAIDINATTSCAVLASFLPGLWNAPSDLGPRHRLQLVDLPFGQINISATLIGENNLSIKPVEGMLFLGEDGHATFLEW
jgi:hypothetical protein